MEAVDADDDFLLVRVGPFTVSLQSHETIIRTGKEAGLGDDKILRLCHLSDLERDRAAIAKGLRDTAEDDWDAFKKWDIATREHISVMEQIMDIGK